MKNILSVCNLDEMHFFPSEKKYKWEQALNVVKGQCLPARNQDLKMLEKVGISELRTLAKKGYLSKFEKSRFEMQTQQLSYDPSKIKTLNEEQCVAIDPVLQQLADDHSLTKKTFIQKVLKLLSR